MLYRDSFELLTRDNSMGYQKSIDAVLEIEFGSAMKEMMYFDD